MAKLGLCLSGGGARGAYQIGALVALQELGIYDKVEAISGASIGAANASIIASNTIEEAKDLWFNIPKNPLGDSKSLLKTIKKDKFGILENGLYSMEIFEKVLLKGINFNNFKNQEVYISVSESGSTDDSFIKLFKSSIDHYVKGESKVKYLKLNDLDKDTAISAVKASCSIPVAFSPIVLENKKYYDGGVYDNAPVTPLIETGCDEIIHINISMLNQSKKLMKTNKDVKIHEIKSSKNLGAVLDFKTENSYKLYNYGYDDTIKYFKGIGYKKVTKKDSEKLIELWNKIDGVGLRSIDDSVEGINKFISRNPKTCFLCEKKGSVIGSIMVGHDGRRGYIYHLSVLEEERKQGIGKRLVDKALDALKEEGINKVALVVFEDNSLGNQFWEKNGFTKRDDLVYRNLSLNKENV